MLLKRQEIIEKLAEKGYTKKGSGIILDDVLRTITEVLVEGNDVMLHGFGTFYVRDMADRATVDLNTKERIVIPGHKTPKFAAGEALKRRVREGVIRD